MLEEKKSKLKWRNMKWNIEARRNQKDWECFDFSVSSAENGVDSWPSKNVAATSKLSIETLMDATTIMNIEKNSLNIGKTQYYQHILHLFQAIRNKNQI